MGHSGEAMAKRPTKPKELPDAVREAVERTVQATVGSAQLGQRRAQDAVDEIVRGAESSLARSREAVRGALDDRRPATQDDLRDLRGELRAIGRRLDSIEERLPARRARAAGTRGGGAKGGGAKRGGAKRGGSKPGGAKRRPTKGRKPGGSRRAR